MILPSFFKFSLIFMKMQMRYRTISNCTCITYDIKEMQQCWFDDGLRPKSVYYDVFYGFPLIYKVFINIHKYANEATLI